MRSLTTISFLTGSFLTRGALLAFVFIIAAVLLFGPAGLRPEPQSAEAAFLAEVKKVLASDAEAGDFFGSSIAVSGDTAVVGAQLEDEAGSDAGAAYVLRRDEGGAGNWGEVKKLTASDAEADDRFGFSVAISGDTAIVGAVREDAGGSDAGAAYVFQRDQGGQDNWGEVKKLTASDAEAGDEFGYSVAISGDTALVGAIREDAGGSDAGAAYVFQRSQGGADNWGEVKKFTASDVAALDHFGSGVAVSGDTAIVGRCASDACLGAEPVAMAAGAAYVFQRSLGGADNWGEVTKVTASDAQASDRFGFSVAVSGNIAVVGALGASNFVGAAYVLERDEGGQDNWGEVTKLSAGQSIFGSSVAVSGDTAVVGAFGEEASGGGILAGAAYVFQRDEGGTGNWGQVSKLIGSDTQAFDFFGARAAVSGQTAVIGAINEDEGGSGAGAAYVFDLLGPKTTPPITSTPTPTSTPCAPGGCPVFGAAMSLRVDAAQTFPCAGGPVAGKVCVHLNQKFDVVVVADAIPVGGYIAALAWVDYDSQGLVDKKNTAALWPDCEPATFLTIQDAGVHGAFAGCKTRLLPPQPPSFHNGDLYSFSLTCTSSASTNNIQLLPSGDPVAGTEGALFIEHTTGNQIIPSVSGITVNCAAKPPKLPHPGDSDGDGCSDQQENGPDETLGGQRDYLNPNDFYDVAGDPNPPQNGAPDGVIDLPNDILGVIQHHPAGTLGYDALFDRGPWTGPDSWNATQEPDGVIDLPNDVLGVILQFNHRCV